MRCNRAFALSLLLAMSMACERESRPFRDLPVAAARTQTASPTQLYAGPPPAAPIGTLSPYQENAWGISEGKRLYSAYNCVGCHSQGGGGIGPALMDDEWIYGWEPANVFSTIVEGRPNGMPSFLNKIPDMQVWQLVAYVQSMSGQTPTDAESPRGDHLRAHPPDTQLPYTGRTQTGHK